MQTTEELNVGILGMSPIEHHITHCALVLHVQPKATFPTRMGNPGLE
jgi:hypothetical protein